MKRAVVAAVGLALAAIGSAGPHPARAQVTDDVVKIGVLTDMSSLYSDINGQGAVVATQMAIDEMGGKVLGKQIELVQADVQNKPDVAVSTAGRWYDVDKVDVILGTGASSSSIATMGVAGQKTEDLSGDRPGLLGHHRQIVQPLHGALGLRHRGAGQRHRLGGGQGRRQDLVLPDRRLRLRLCPRARCDRGGQGEWRQGHRRRARTRSTHPTSRRFCCRRRRPRRKVIGLANAGGDTINSIKQAGEFGIVKGGQKLAGLLVFITDVHSLGLQLAQGLNLTEAFYWDQDDATRAFGKRFGEKFGGKMPTSIQAGFYSAAKRYIEAIKEAGTDDADKVMAALKAKPFDDPVFGKSMIRPDGRNVHDMYLFEVKKPAELKGPWDYYKLIRSIPGAEAFRPMDQGECPMVKKG